MSYFFTWFNLQILNFYLLAVKSPRAAGSLPVLIDFPRSPGLLRFSPAIACHLT